MNVLPQFDTLPLGAVMPQGWIRAQMRRDLDEGFAGCLDELTERAASDLFANRIATSSAQVSWWDAETRGNWLWGYVMMAFLAGHPGHQARAGRLMAALKSTQDEDGYIGVYVPGSRYNHPPGENGELWAQSRALLPLLAFAELSGDARYREAVERAVALTMQHYGPGRPYFQSDGVESRSGLTGLTHGLCYTDVLEWLHGLTGDEAYARFGAWLYQDFSAMPLPFPNDDLALASLLDPSRPFTGHAVHTAEHFRPLLWAYTLTGSDRLAQGVKNAFARASHYTMLSGALLGDEALRDCAGPRIGYEYCTITELLFSLTSALQKLGRASFGDWIENLAFNAGQGARLADGKALGYLSTDTRLAAVASLPDGYSPLHGSGRYKYSPTHEDVACCCNPNATRLMPHYVSRMWMRLRDEPGVIAAAYGPCTLTTPIDGVRVRIDEATNYPFDDTITFTISAEQPARFALILRQPAWAAAMQVHAADARATEDDGWRRLEKTWVTGDRVTVRFTAATRVSAYANGDLGVHHGPLQYVLPIPHRFHATRDYPRPGLHDYDITPASAELADLPAELASAALQSLHLERRDDADPDDPWARSPLLLTNGALTLVPMGCTVLRQATFTL